jgi:hypothetical protein
LSKKAGQPHSRHSPAAGSPALPARHHRARGVRGGPVFALIPALALAFLLALSGCGSTTGKVNDYCDSAENILNGVEESYNNLKGFWGEPLGGQATLKTALYDFRSRLSSAQSEVDGVDAPSPCRELSGLLRRTLNVGREYADASSQFADYADSMAPAVQKVDEVVAALEQLEEEKDIPSGFTALKDKVDSANVDFMQVLAPPSLKDVHAEFQEFFLEVTGVFTEAEEKLADYWGDLDEEELEKRREDSGDEDEDDQPRVKKETPENRALAGILEDVGEEWGQLTGGVLALMDGLREATGLNQKQAEMDSMIAQTRQKLEVVRSEYPD